MNKLRIGVLSTASIAPRFIKAVQQTDCCEVLALASRTLDRAQEKAALWGVPCAYGDYAALFQDVRLDAVYIPVINNEHFIWAKRALDAGKHVLCEKPCTMSPADTRALFALAREKGLFLMEMNKIVFLPVMRELRRRIQAGTLGAIRLADFTNYTDPSYNSWFTDLEKGGGPLYGHAVYSLQLMQFLLDCRAEAFCGLCTGAVGKCEDQVSMTVRMENGTLVANKTSLAVATQNTAFLYGEKAWVEIPNYWKARKAILHFPDGTSEILDYPCEYELRYEMEHAAACIRSGLTESPVMTEDMSVRAIEIIDCLQKGRC